MQDILGHVHDMVDIMQDIMQAINHITFWIYVHMADIMQDILVRGNTLIKQLDLNSICLQITSNEKY